MAVEEPGPEAEEPGLGDAQECGRTAGGSTQLTQPLQDV
jgi:hypothetical protein